MHTKDSKQAIKIVKKLKIISTFKEFVDALSLLEKKKRVSFRIYIFIINILFNILIYIISRLVKVYR